MVNCRQNKEGKANVQLRSARLLLYNLMDSGCQEHRASKKKRSPEQINDYNGHGTHVSGIIGGNGYASGGTYTGMAPGCRLLPIKVLDHKGGGNTEQVRQAIFWMLEKKEKYQIRILNISVGMLKNAREEEQVELIKLVEQVWEEGLVVVAAAGNNGPMANSVTIPGICRSIITVGSSDDEEAGIRSQGLRRGYSGRGPTDSCVIKPEILAPGTRITSCDLRENAYTTKSGTSMATPIVSGAIALLLQGKPELTNKEVKYLLWESCEKSGETPGWGLLRLDRLLIP